MYTLDVACQAGAVVAGAAGFSALQRLPACVTEIDVAYSMVGTGQSPSSGADGMQDLEPNTLVPGSSEADLPLTSKQSAAPSELVQMAAQATDLVSQQDDVIADPKTYQEIE